LGRVRAVFRLCDLYPGICLTTEEKARKNLIQHGNASVYAVWYDNMLEGEQSGE